MSHALHDSAALPGALAGSTPAEQATADDARRFATRAERLRSILAESYAFLWRSLRRLGVSEAEVEDAAQKCVWVLAERIDDIEAGKERAFLFGVALRVSKSFRRQHKERCAADYEDALAELPSAGPTPAEALDDRRSRALLDAMLASMPLDLHVVFVLYELEELTMAEIAQMLDLPSGTVASRLRRARAAFDAISRRVQRRFEVGEGRR